MPLSVEHSQEDENYRLIATLSSPKQLVALLKSVHIKDYGMIFATAHGIKVTVEESKCVQANAFIEAGTFRSYVIREDDITFKINITVLLECLSIFGSNAPGRAIAVKMCYEGHGMPLIVMLEEDGVVTNCKLNTMEPDDVLNFDFSTATVVNKVILKSEALKDFFQELDLSSDVLQMLLTPDPPHFRLSTFGHAGNFHMECSKTSSIMETFQCTQKQTNRYKTSLIKPSFKALVLSQKISIRTDDRGFLCMQYVIVTDNFDTAFVEYYCSPEEELDD